MLSFMDNSHINSEEYMSNIDMNTFLKGMNNNEA